MPNVGGRLDRTRYGKNQSENRALLESERTDFQDANPTGDYSICRVELQENSDGLIFHTLSWGYDSEAEAIAAVRKIAEENQVDVTEIAIIKVISAADLQQQGLLS
jgi:hypothetical protein